MFYFAEICHFRIQLNDKVSSAHSNDISQILISDQTSLVSKFCTMNEKSPKSDLFSINCFFNPGLLEIPVYFDLQVLLPRFIRDPGLLEIPV